MIHLVYLLFGRTKSFSSFAGIHNEKIIHLTNYKWVGFCVFESVQCINIKRLNHTVKCFKDKIFFNLNLVIIDLLRAA